MGVDSVTKNPYSRYLAYTRMTLIFVSFLIMTFLRRSNSSEKELA